MASRRFDSLLRHFQASGTRRVALAALLAGWLGGPQPEVSAAKKKRKKKKKCPCPGGRVRLANGSCAKPCDDENDCPTLCECASGSVEGKKYCTADVTGCSTIPIECSTTAGCPLGQYCLGIGIICMSNRCAPLCG